MCRIRAGGGCARVEGTVSNTLKGGGREKRGETKILKGGRGKLGQGVGLERLYELYPLIATHCSFKTLYQCIK